jgi:hypothetical protein
MDKGVGWTIKSSEAKKWAFTVLLKTPFSSDTILESLLYLIEKLEMRDIDSFVGAVGTKPARG